MMSAPAERDLAAFIVRLLFSLKNKGNIEIQTFEHLNAYAGNFLKSYYAFMKISVGSPDYDLSMKRLQFLILYYLLQETWTLYFDSATPNEDIQHG